MNIKLKWNQLAAFFEHGDLTPLAVVISIAHYGPVLESHGEHWFVAWIVGALIDLLHFRSIRRATNNLSWLTAVTGLATTAMAIGYHWRFYDGDWLFALPIPVGIAILAQHAASDSKQDASDLLTAAETAQAEAVQWQTAAETAQAEAEAALAMARKARKEAEVAQAEATEWEDRATSAQRLADRRQKQLDEWQAIVQAWQAMNDRYQTVAKLNAGLISKEDAMAITNLSRRSIEMDAAKLNGVAHD